MSDYNRTAPGDPRHREAAPGAESAEDRMAQWVAEAQAMHDRVSQELDDATEVQGQERLDLTQILRRAAHLINRQRKTLHKRLGYDQVEAMALMRTVGDSLGMDVY